MAAPEEDEDDDEDELEPSLASAFAGDDAATLGAGLFGAATLDAATLGTGLFGAAKLGGGLRGASMLAAFSSSYCLSSIASTPFFAPLTSCKS